MYVLSHSLLHLWRPVLRLHLGPFSVITFILVKANLWDGNRKNSYANQREWLNLCFLLSIQHRQIRFGPSRRQERKAKALMAMGDADQARMWFTSFLWPWDSALQECSRLTSLTGGPSPGGAVTGRNNNLFVPHREHQPARWERLKSDEGRERSKGRTEEFGKKLQRLKPWLSPLPFVFVSIGWILSTLLLVHWAMDFLLLPFSSSE